MKMKTVKWILLSLNLDEYTHILVRRHSSGGAETLGGGNVSSVLSRFGNLYVTDSSVRNDGIFVLFVRCDDV